MDDTDDRIPDVPDEFADFDLGDVHDRMGPADVNTASSDRFDDVWIPDEERGRVYWFEILPANDVPLRKKNSVLAEHLTVDEDGNPNLGEGYYTDMLQYQIRDWSGKNKPDAPGLVELLTRITVVFEELQEHAPAPMQGIEDELQGK